MPLVVLCEVLSLFLLTYTSALSLHWPERQSRVADTMQCWKLPSLSGAWDLVTGSSSLYLPRLCYRISQKASKPHKQIDAGLVQSSTHGRDQTRLTTRDGSGLSSSWTSLHAATDDLSVMDHFVGGGGKERQLKNGRHPGGVFTQLGDSALHFCLYNEDIEQDVPLGGPTASYFPNQRSNLHLLHWKCEVLPQDHQRSPWTVMCLFNTNISWFWRIAPRGDSSYILEKSIYSVLTGYIFKDHNCAFPLLKTFCILSCIIPVLRNLKTFWFLMLCMEMFILEKLIFATYEKYLFLLCFIFSLCAWHSMDIHFST